jgi:hypothetical protein
MRKLFGLLLFVLCLSVPARAQVVLAFDYDTSKDALCSATVTQDCVKEFGVGILVNGVVTQIATITPPSCSGTGTVTCTTPQLPAVPSRKYKLNTYTAWAVSVDGFKSANSNTVDVQLPPGAPKNLRIQ